jgi:hypothetical protein
MDELGGACSTDGEMKIAYKISVGLIEGKRPRQRNTEEDNIKIYLKDIRLMSRDEMFRIWYESSIKGE